MNGNMGTSFKTFELVSIESFRKRYLNSHLTLANYFGFRRHHHRDAQLVPIHWINCLDPLHCGMTFNSFSMLLPQWGLGSDSACSRLCLVNICPFLPWRMYVAELSLLCLLWAQFNVIWLLFNGFKWLCNHTMSFLFLISLLSLAPSFALVHKANSSRANANLHIFSDLI